MNAGKIAGVKLKINIFFLLLAAIYSYLGFGWEVLIIMMSVLIHEIAHSVTALSLGVKIAEIELLPFGGQAKIEDFTGLDPGKEIYIALAGPVCSLAMAGLFYYSNYSFSSQYLPLFININFYLGIFNLLPALPLDGGRILRSILSRSMGYKLATSRTALWGKIIAAGIVGYGVYLFYQQYNGANFILIGVFLYWAANREAKFLAYTFIRYLVNKKSELSSRGFLDSKQVVSQPESLVKDILASTRPSYYTVVMLVDEKHHLQGMLTEAELIECLFEKGPAARLKDCFN